MQKKLNVIYKVQSSNDNLVLARKICDEVKQETVCSNDIIPRTQLPWLTSVMMPYAINKFGRDRINAYLRFTNYMGNLRDLITIESQEKRISSAVSSSAIAIAKLGVGECQELSIFSMFKLISLGRHDVAFVVFKGKVNELNPSKHPFLHSIILLGVGQNFSLQKGSMKQLEFLPDHVVILDPLLNYVGRASDYLNDQAQYLTIFGYDEVFLIDVVTKIHIDNHPIIGENVRQLMAHAENRGILPFERSLFDLPIVNNSSLHKKPCEETALLQGLNTNSGLMFSGFVDDRFHVDAVAEIHSESESQKAKSIQSKLGAGCFYTGASQRFFVIHKINVSERPDKDLPRRIHDNYCNYK